jgi:hypothetical protein
MPRPFATLWIALFVALLAGACNALSGADKIVIVDRDGGGGCDPDAGCGGGGGGG